MGNDQYDGPTEALTTDLPPTSLKKINALLEGAYGTGSGGSGGTSGGGSAVKVAQGGLRNVPAGTTNGTELPGRPSATSGARFEIPDGATVVIFFAPTGTSPGSPPSATKTIGPFDGGATVDEPTSATDSIFVTSTTGAQSLFRWVQR